MSQFLVRLAGLILLFAAVSAALTNSFSFIYSFRDGSAPAIQIALAAILASFPTFFLALVFLFWSPKRVQSQEFIQSDFSLMQQRTVFRLIAIAIGLYFVGSSLMGLMQSVFKFALIQIDPMSEMLSRNFYYFIRNFSNEIDYFSGNIAMGLVGTFFISSSSWLSDKLIK